LTTGDAQVLRKRLKRIRAKVPEKSFFWEDLASLKGGSSDIEEALTKA